MQLLDQLKESQLFELIKVLSAAIKTGSKLKDLALPAKTDFEKILLQVGYRLTEKFGQDILGNSIERWLVKNSNTISNSLKRYNTLDPEGFSQDTDFGSLPPNFLESLDQFLREEAELYDLYGEKLRDKLDSLNLTRILDIVESIETQLATSNKDKLSQTELLEVQKNVYKPVTDYISRSFSGLGSNKLEEYKPSLEYVLSHHKRAVILGFGGLGKSTDLKQYAAELSSITDSIFPIFISLKDYTSEAIEELLSKEFPIWPRIPASNLIVFFDGLDEIDLPHFRNFFRQLNKFSGNKEHEGMTIVVSCRSSFYITEEEQPEGLLRGFKTFRLDELGPSEQAYELYKRLGKEHGRFSNQTRALGLEDLLKSPFFLIQLVNVYKADGKLPITRELALDAIIEYRLAFDKYKLDNHSIDIRENEVLIRQTLEKVAFACQCNGKNLISGNQLQKIIPDRHQRDLIKHTFIFTKRPGEESWEFEVSIIQEYLAARVLSRLEFDQVLQLMAAGVEGDRIKPSWINCVTILLDILNPNSELFDKLVLWVKTNQEGLIVKIAKQQLDKSFREELFLRIFQEHQKNGLIVRNSLYDTIDLSRLVSDSEMVKDLMISFISTSSQMLPLNQAIQILRDMALSKDQNWLLKEALLAKAISSDLDPEVREKCIEALKDFSLLDMELIETLINKIDTAGLKAIRIEILEAVNQLNAAHEFFDFVLHCFDNYDQGYSKYMSVSEQNAISTAIGSIKDILLIEKFLLFLSENGGNHQFRHDSGLLGACLSKIFKRLIGQKQVSPSLYDTFFKFLLEYDHRYAFYNEKAEELKDMIAFLQHHQLVGATICGLIEEKEFRLMNIICRKALSWKHLDDISKTVLDMQPTLNQVVTILTWLPENKADFQQALINNLSDELGYRISLPEIINYKEQENQKILYGLRLTRSIDAFKDRIRGIFNELGKTQPSPEELTSYRYDKDAKETIIPAFLEDLAAKHSKKGKDFITVNDALRKIEKDWDGVKIQILLENTLYNSDLELELPEKEYIRKWVKQELRKLDFDNLLYQKDEHIHWHWQSNYIAYFFMAGFVKIDNATLLKLTKADWYGIPVRHRTTQNNETDEKTSLLSNIINEVGFERVKRKIINNLMKDKLVKPVLDAHIAICAKHSIKEALPVLTDLILAESKEYRTHHSLEQYFTLGGSAEKLLPVFKEFGVYEQLEICRKGLAEGLSMSEQLSYVYNKDHAEYKIEYQLRVIKLMIEAKNLKGLELLINLLGSEKRTIGEVHIEDLRELEKHRTYQLAKEGFRIYNSIGFNEGRFDQLKQVFIQYLTEAASTDTKYFKEVHALFSQVLKKQKVKTFFSVLEKLEQEYYQNQEQPVQQVLVSRILQEVV